MHCLNADNIANKSKRRYLHHFRIKSHKTLQVVNKLPTTIKSESDHYETKA